VEVDLGFRASIVVALEGKSEDCSIFLAPGIAWRNAGMIRSGRGITMERGVIVGQHVSFHTENHVYDSLDVPIKQQGITRKDSRR
jgi:hypothetical protein